MKLPYGRQSIEQADIDAVCEALHSEWLTTGPQVEQFEQNVAETVEVPHAVALSSGTAAVHACMHAIDLQPGDEVIVPAITFAASSNGAVYKGGIPRFADVLPTTLCIDPESVLRKLTPKTRAIVAVDYAGQACDYESLLSIARKHGLALIGDACHALGGSYQGKAIGSVADITAFSFHPVKHITTGEGGMVTTSKPEYATRARAFRNHGIYSTHRDRDRMRTFEYDMVDLGFNYRMCDFQAALGRSQLARLREMIQKRQSIAAAYDRAFESTEVSPLVRMPNVSHAYHLYVIKLPNGSSRNYVFQKMRDADILVNVHYKPVYLHSFYRSKFGYGPGECPVAEAEYERILSLPMYPGLTDSDVQRVIESTLQAVREADAR